MNIETPISKAGGHMQQGASDGGVPSLASDARRLTSTSVLARSAAWTLIGQIVPLGLAIVSVPLLTHGLGKDRFGVLTLAWLFVGYFSLFDLGLGRALTQVVADRLGMGREQEIPRVVWTSLLLMLGMGLVGTLVTGIAAPRLVWRVLRIPVSLKYETLVVFRILSISLPVVILGSGLRGILEAYQKSRACNIVGVLLSIFLLAGPLLVLPFSHSLIPAVSVLVLGRVIGLLAYLVLCLRITTALRGGFTPHPAAVLPLFRLGGWMTISNVISPMMVYLDRFLIGAWISVEAVTYYAVPYEVATKLWLVPTVLVRVLFPAFATSFAHDRKRTAVLFGQGVRSVFIAMVPLTFVVVLFAREILGVWMGADYAHHGSRVLQWIALGVFINSVGQIAFTLVQGLGRPDLTAKFHLIELPFYLLAIWGLIGPFGIEGAALAWMLRVALDAVLLFAAANRLLPDVSLRHRQLGLLAIIAFLGLIAADPHLKMFVKGIILVSASAAFVPIAWLRILSPEERALVLIRFKKPSPVESECGSRV